MCGFSFIILFMTIFDSLFFNVFHHYKPKYKRKANTIALCYVSMLQISLLLFSGVVLAIFLNEMNTTTMSSEKAWSLFIMGSIFIHFRNWMQYTGKKRSIINAKRNRKQLPQHYNIWMLWALLIGCLFLSVSFLFVM